LKLSVGYNKSLEYYSPEKLGVFHLLDRNQSQNKFLSSIDRGLDAFGSNVRVVVYFELEKLHRITREQIPLKPELFVATINKLFGVGASTVSRAVCRELEKSSGISGLSSKDLLTAIRTAYHAYVQENSR